MRSRNHCCRGKAISVTYSEWVFLAVVIQLLMFMCRIIFYLWPVRLYRIFPHYLKKTRFTGGGMLRGIEFRFQATVRDLFMLQRRQVLGPSLPPIQVGNERFFPGERAAWLYAGHLLRLVARLRINGVKPPLAHKPSRLAQEQIFLTISVQKYRSWSPSVRNSPPVLVTCSLLRPNTLLGTRFSDTFNTYYVLRLGNKILLLRKLQKHTT